MRIKRHYSLRVFKVVWYKKDKDLHGSAPCTAWWSTWPQPFRSPKMIEQLTKVYELIIYQSLYMLVSKLTRHIQECTKLHSPLESDVYIWHCCHAITFRGMPPSTWKLSLTLTLWTLKSTQKHHKFHMIQCPTSGWKASECTQYHHAQLSPRRAGCMYL